jgi:hypothetical protein
MGRTCRKSDPTMSTTVGVKPDDATRLCLKERHDDEARWARYQESGQAIPREWVMQWLDALAAGIPGSQP